MKEIPEYPGVLELAGAIKAAKLAQDRILDDTQAPSEISAPQAVNGA
jgi:hypothetical protein